MKAAIIIAPGINRERDYGHGAGAGLRHCA